MPSRTEIVNLALLDAHAGMIQNVDNDDGKSIQCKLIFDNVLLEMLTQDEWKFALTRVSLAADTTSPLNAWSSQYTLPADCVKPIRINNDDAQTWTQEGDKLFTDTTAPIILEYVNSSATNPNTWNGAFIRAFRTELAKRYNWAFRDGDKVEILQVEAEMAKHEAIARNGQIGTPPAPIVGALTTNIRKY